MDAQIVQDAQGRYWIAVDHWVDPVEARTLSVCYASDLGLMTDDDIEDQCFVPLDTDMSLWTPWGGERRFDPVLKGFYRKLSPSCQPEDPLLRDAVVHDQGQDWVPIRVICHVFQGHCQLKQMLWPGYYVSIMQPLSKTFEHLRGVCQTDFDAFLYALRHAGFDANIKPENQHTLLCSIIDLSSYILRYGGSAGLKDVFETVLQQGAQLNQPMPLLEHGASIYPLYRIIEHASPLPDVLEIFESCGGDLTVVDTLGQNALHYAVQARSAEWVQLLIQAGVDQLIKSKEGLTPLDMAEQLGVKALIRAFDMSGTVS